MIKMMTTMTGVLWAILAIISGCLMIINIFQGESPDINFIKMALALILMQLSVRE